MGRETDDQRRGREADALSDFRAFLSSYRRAVFFEARGMDDQAAPHSAAAREEGRYVLAHLLQRDVTEAEADRLIRIGQALDQERP